MLFELLQPIFFTEEWSNPVNLIENPFTTLQLCKSLADENPKNFQVNL